MNPWLITDDLGVTMPWYTHGALAEIRTWDLTGKVVLEYGGGLSTRWWASRTACVYTVETSAEWAQTIRDFGLDNVTLELRDPTDEASYVRLPDGCAPDIVVIDGEHRTSCLRLALALPRPLVAIFDNWQQSFVYIDPVAEAMMEPYKATERLYVQPDHTNHDGKPWTTAIWILY